MSINYGAPPKVDKDNPLGYSNSGGRLTNNSCGGKLSTTLPGKNYPAKYGREDASLPLAAKRLYGCENCSWRLLSYNLCPFGFNKKTDVFRQVDRVGQLRDVHICSERVNWLKAFTPDDRKQSSFSSWHENFLLGVAGVKMDEDLTRLKVLDLSISDLVDGNKPVPKVMKEERDKLDDRWHHKLVELQKAISRKLDREERRQIDLTVGDRIKISNINEVIAMSRDITPKDLDSGNSDESVDL